ncbi:ribosomal protein L24E [Caldisphaera lagunensis DSM 15908]|uniref:Large ribosomal subunit protein eL24 n=1 Tax=Caldisphaera lagunensis (strain DSM 15908 / JCM 11604 / ANMR 0165 / IC-154) TaxID=1056495 RepID=L0AAZ8_CALLD|nr:50S ribosomal protein L24e [Caldisphaera lagunensis]AFZ70205.1 ribosomal protein L24E [Caldisphaera lagunensis DSM 15908]
MPKEMICSFCGGIVEPGTGKMYIGPRGEIMWFCSSKCYKNSIKLGRKSRKLKWVTKLSKKLI